MSQNENYLFDNTPNTSRSAVMWADAYNAQDETYASESGSELPDLISPEKAFQKSFARRRHSVFSASDFKLPLDTELINRRQSAPYSAVSDTLFLPGASTNLHSQHSAVHMFVMKKLPEGRAKEKFMREIIDYNTPFKDRLKGLKGPVKGLNAIDAVRFLRLFVMSKEWMHNCTGS